MRLISTGTASPVWTAGGSRTRNRGQQMQISSVLDHLGGQLSRLCTVLGMDPEIPVSLLADLLGPHGIRPLTQPPAWPSDVADDNSPVEFSVAYNDTEP